MATYNNNGNGNDKVDWVRLIYQSEFYTRLLADLGYRPEDIKDENPITATLASNDSFVTVFDAMFGKEFNRTSVSKLATLCQMIVFDNIGGPEHDSKPKALRRHWYAWYKTRFAQPFAKQLGDYEVVGGVVVYNDLAWSQRLSQTYAWFVDKAKYLDNACPNCHGNDVHFWAADDAECNYCHHTWQPAIVRITYKDLWVEDASRMMKMSADELFRHAHIVVAVEKDSLFADFDVAARSLGARAIISGKGKSSKAAIEKMLRDYFYWTSDGTERYDHKPIFSRGTPMHVIHVSDHDYDGEHVIGPTFAEQVRRYTPHVKEARVGIKPEDMADKGYSVSDQMYSVKLSNKGYQKWARNQALFLAECVNCGHTALTKGTVDDRDYDSEWPGYCPECNGPFVSIHVTGQGADIAYGLEVEAMRVADYRDLLVWTLLTILDFNYIVLKLRDEATAIHQDAIQRVIEDIAADNPSYQAMVEEYERLQTLKRNFEQSVYDSIQPAAVEQINMFDWEGPDPRPEEYVSHVEDAGGWVWRPFDRANRTRLLTQLIFDEAPGLISAYKLEDVESYEIYTRLVWDNYNGS